jgi:flagellar basal body rod protein FlgG
MNYGFNIGAAGVISSMYRQDVAANNLANIETVGFKPDISATIPRDAARIEDNLGLVPSNAMLERLSAGIFLAPTRTSFSQGVVARSGNPLDVAIKGEGFLAVSAPGMDGKDGPRLTRDGRLTMDTNGRLVTTTGNRPVLDTSNSPITLDPRLPIDIDTDGTIRQGGAAVARLQFVEPATAQKLALRKLGANLFDAPGLNVNALPPATGTIVQHATEASASDPIKAMMEVQNAANGVGTNVRVMQIHDELMNRAITGLGRVSA